MGKLLSILALLLSGCFASYVSAAGFTYQVGVVNDVRVSSTSGPVGNPTHFQITGNAIVNASCTGTWWFIDTDTTSGKALLSALLSAQATGKQVKVWGNSSRACGPLGWIEAGQVAILGPGNS